MRFVSTGALPQPLPLRSAIAQGLLARSPLASDDAPPISSNEKRAREVRFLVEMKWTGHSDYKAMKPYIDIAEKTKANAMNLFEMELKK